MNNTFWAIVSLILLLSDAQPTKAHETAQKKLLNKFCAFSVEQCKIEPYNRLKSCKLAVNAPETLAELSSNFLCSNRDVMKESPEVESKSSNWSMGFNHSVSKRSTDNKCNICMTRSTQQIIYAAQDAEYGTSRLLELLQDPSRNLYQTYSIQICEPNIQSMVRDKEHKCGKQMIEFRAAVFNDDDTVRAQRVRYPTTCALQYDC